MLIYIPYIYIWLSNNTLFLIPCDQEVDKTCHYSAYMNNYKDIVSIFDKNLYYS